VVLRVDYFENYAGRFLSVEAKDRLGGSTPTSATYTGPTLSLSWNRGPGTPIDSPPRVMNVNIDPDYSEGSQYEARQCRMFARLREANLRTRLAHAVAPCLACASTRPRLRAFSTTTAAITRTPPTICTTPSTSAKTR
jgi:hypothetical protein